MPETVVHFQIRMPPAMHEQLASRARDTKQSLNALIVGILSEANAATDAALEGSPSRPRAPHPVPHGSPGRASRGPA